MEDYIAIANLNDFIFCPYSIYLHSVYMESDEDMYKAVPQLSGSEAHKRVDCKTTSTRKGDLAALPVCCDELGVVGVIDIYKSDRRLLIERKNNLKQLFRGQIYQLWAQYFCMIEMGYLVERIAFYEISTNKMHYLPLPSDKDKAELLSFISEYRSYRPDKDTFSVNPNKCRHCIYCNLCDKTDCDNVYT